MISGNVPNHLTRIAQAGFLTSYEQNKYPSNEPISRLYDMTQKNQVMVDLGAAPMPTKRHGKFNAQDFIEKSLKIEPQQFEIPVWISGNAVKDDQTGTLLGRVKSAGENFNRHLAQQAYKTLNDGDDSSIINSIGYDGLPYFSNSHVDKGAAYQTTQDNVESVSLSIANFNLEYAKAQLFKNDQGEVTDYTYDTLIVDPTNRVTAHQICFVPGGTDQPTNANPNAGLVKPIITPKFDTGAWILTASQETIKPVIITMRERPHLEDAWKDPEGDDGGTFYFLFTGRYNFYLSDWRLSFMGHS